MAPQHGWREDADVIWRSHRAAKGLSRRLLVIVLCAILIAPGAMAHIQGARPIFQRGQRDRTVFLEPGALEVDATLTVATDPLRHPIQHTIDPTRGVYAVEYRADASRLQDRFFAEWRFERLVEYRDQNVDGYYQPASDTAVKAWRITHYQWQRVAMQRAQVSDVAGDDIVWEGNLSGGPHQRAEVVIAGRDFTDEGAVVRPQDIILYHDLTNMPVRGLGSLYAFEATITVPREATLSLHEAQNTSTALVAELGLRRAVLVWGGEAVLDGVEQRIDATLEGERIGDDGNKTARLVLHLPTVDASMRFVMVSGVEYLIEDKGTPMAWALVLLGVIFAHLFRRK